MSAQTGTRTFNTACRTSRLLAKQFNTNADVFTQTDPSAGGTPLTLTRATGMSGMDGNVTLTFTSGFTPTLNLTFYEWQADLVNSANASWVRCGNAATGKTSYKATVDSNYAKVAFSIAENTPFLVLADQSVTGNVYTDAPPHILNNNSVTGYVA